MRKARMDGRCRYPRHSIRTGRALAAIFRRIDSSMAQLAIICSVAPSCRLSISGDSGSTSSTRTSHTDLVVYLSITWSR
ncbi:hypothetical protein C1I98_26380 [Spongiactinospora gelatinilytica]|uniref:Uncharacterized protein n=1 Tax=Spongiactinospora gelatinilytica TaxID=2666298 RepID=A0A2W2GI25_9ACTN|nr:hypothetical protein C1I98_26380 [Spongiactinospora gelatinilytica]